MSELALVQVAEGISLVLLFSAFVIMAIYASRATKTVRSLPFQLFLIITILLLSEGPRLLEGTGLIRSVLTTEVEVLGLAFHTIAMVTMVGFIGYRVSLFRGQFGNVLLQGISEGLTKAFGSKTARVFKFYIDPNIAITYPLAYERALKHWLGKGYPQVLQIIIKEINHKAGLKNKEGQTIAECLKAAKAKLA